MEVFWRKFSPFWPSAAAALGLAIIAGLLFGLFTGDNIKSGVVAAIGTFFGAATAFAFNVLKTERDRREDRIEIASAALFTLFQMLNETELILQNCTQPMEGRHDAWLNLPPPPPLNEKYSLDVGRLSYFIQAMPEVCSGLFLEESRFRSLSFNIQQYNEVSKRAWDSLSSAGLKINEQRETEEMKKIIGTADVRRLEAYSSAIISHTRDNVGTLEAAFNNFRAELTRIYPDRKFLRVVLLPAVENLTVDVAQK